MFIKSKFKLTILSIPILIFSLVLCGNGSKVFASSNRTIKYGAFFADKPTTQGINDFETLQQKHLDTVNMFVNWKTNFSDIKKNFDAVYENGSTMSLTWEAWGLSNSDIASGKKDDYIKQMAEDMKAYNKNIVIRLFHEGNGNWYDWAIGDSKVNTNETYIAAYRHVVDIFRAVGATNVKWNYNVNCSSVGTGASYLEQYPGDDYVDIISIDGYNWGTTQSWGSKWQSFDEIFSQAYNALKVKNKPIELSEFSSTEIGGDKAAWFTDAFKQINSDKYSLINSVVCFSINKETDWRINSSESALKAYIDGIHMTGTNTDVKNSTITPETFSFDKNDSAVKDIAVKMDLNGNTLSSIENGTNKLVEGTDYTVSDNTVTILKGYLAKQPVGITNLTFKFSAGKDQVLSVNVSDSLSQTGNLKVQEYNGNTADSINTINPRFRLVNTGKTAIDLSKAKIRYYYTIDDEKAQVFNCDWSTVGSSNVTGTFVKMPVAKTCADYYLEVGFTKEAGSLAPGQSIEVQCRINRTDWSNYTQIGDYSLNTASSNYADCNNVTAYLSGELTWGMEP
ncbi:MULTISPECIES: X2-like carbohydrate binding domain-containing protein [Clostridium]|uniref:X2-like carbohydrate binding domain-containing protein n=1 Tax=Clostridium TaxID=1485 RepID=UPI000826CC29|nr:MULTISPECIES: X2-like carbohydrate binding domain-containing protein [Clostridium]PJI07016.1 hypothetical protein CUB90_03670 [Clostridium sp. CT7]